MSFNYRVGARRVLNLLVRILVQVFEVLGDNIKVSGMCFTGVKMKFAWIGVEYKYFYLTVRLKFYSKVVI